MFTAENMFVRLIALAFWSVSAVAFAQTPAGSHPEAQSRRLVEPGLQFETIAAEPPAVALTFDACMGKTDQRILEVLLSERIPATIFVTERWLRRNPQTVAVLRQNPDLFEIEDHGARHLPAVDFPVSVYGIAAAGSPEAVASEVEGGARAIVALGFPAPRWFRGATAKYSGSSMKEITTLGYEIAGYSINGDGGSLLGAAATRKNYLSARSGDVIISHINQPTHKAGEGVVAGILELKKRGFTFVRLQDRLERTEKSPAH